jgi:hypothetical protein
MESPSSLANSSKCVSSCATSSPCILAHAKMWRSALANGHAGCPPAIGEVNRSDSRRQERSRNRTAGPHTDRASIARWLHGRGADPEPCPHEVPPFRRRLRRNLARPHMPGLARSGRNMISFNVQTANVRMSPSSWSAREDGCWKFVPTTATVRLARVLRLGYAMLSVAPGRTCVSG